MIAWVARFREEESGEMMCVLVRSYTRELALAEAIAVAARRVAERAEQGSWTFHGLDRTEG